MASRTMMVQALCFLILIEAGSPMQSADIDLFDQMLDFPSTYEGLPQLPADSEDSLPDDSISDDSIYPRLESRRLRIQKALDQERKLQDRHRREVSVLVDNAVKEAVDTQIKSDVKLAEEHQKPRLYRRSTLKHLEDKFAEALVHVVQEAQNKESARQRLALLSKESKEDQVVTEIPKDIDAVMSITKALSKRADGVEKQLAEVQRIEQATMEREDDMTRSLHDMESHLDGNMNDLVVESDRAAATATDAVSLMKREEEEEQQTQSEVAQLSRELKFTQQATTYITNILKQLTDSMMPDDSVQLAAPPRGFAASPQGAVKLS